MARLDVLDVPVLVLEVDALVVRDVVVNVLLLEEDVLVVRDVVVNVVLIEVDVLVVRDVVVKDVLDVLLLEVDVLAVRDVVVEEVLDVLESLVVDVSVSDLDVLLSVAVVLLDTVRVELVVVVGVSTIMAKISCPPALEPFMTPVVDPATRMLLAAPRESWRWHSSVLLVPSWLTHS